MIRRYCVAIVAMFLVVGAALADDDKNLIQGEWRQLPRKDGLIGATKLVVRGDDWQYSFDDHVRGSLQLGPHPLMKAKLDPTKKMKEIDLRQKMRDIDVTIKCIYKLEGDILTICQPFDQFGDRPKEFKTIHGRTVVS